MKENCSRQVMHIVLSDCRTIEVVAARLLLANVVDRTNKLRAV